MFAQDSVSWFPALALMVGVGAMLVGSGWLIIWIAKRTASGEMGRNAFAGIRTSATGSSDEAWLVAHQAGETLTRRSGWAMVVSGVLAVPIALLLGNGDPQRTTDIWGVVVLIGAAVVLLFIGLGGWKGHQAAKQLQIGD